MEFSSLQGIKSNIELFDKYARDLQIIEKADIPEDMVGMMIAEAGVQANIVALKTAHQMTLGLVDIFA